MFFSATSFCESPFSALASQGLFGICAMEGTSSKASIGVGVLAGSTSMSSNFTKTTTQTFITNSSSFQIANATQTSNAIKVLLISSDASAQFDKTTQGNATFNSSETISSNLQTSVLGEILWEDDISPAETFTIVSGGDETWTIVGTGDEGWIEQ